MQIDFSSISPSQRYFAMTQTIIPRPIAWVLSPNADGGLNLAPFSYFNGVCSDPPLLMLSVGHKPDGSIKDTWANIEQRGDFVVHIAHTALLDPLNESAASWPAGISEVQQLALETVTVAGWRLPRLAACRAAFLCTRHQIHEVGNKGQALILGEIRQLYLDDQIVDRAQSGRITVPPAKLDPLARLGASHYAQLGQLLERKRPTSRASR